MEGCISQLRLKEPLKWDSLVGPLQFPVSFTNESRPNVEPHKYVTKHTSLCLVVKIQTFNNKRYCFSLCMVIYM